MKHVELRLANAPPSKFSPAFCGGLIEAYLSQATVRSSSSFPPRFAGASLKLEEAVMPELNLLVFPRVLRGPH